MLKMVNHRAVELTGYSEQELMSIPFPAVIHTDDRVMVMERYQKRMRGEELPSRYSFRLGLKDASTRWVELSVAVIDWEGRPATLNFLTDITGRKRAEDALKESETKYRMLVETLNEGIWVIDKEAVTTFVNPKMAEILGYTIEEMAGRSLFSFIDDEGKQICDRLIERRQQGIREPHDFEFLKKDGTRIYTTLETSPIKGKDGEYLGAIAGVADITDRKRAEEALLKNAEELHAANELLTASEEELRQNLDDLGRSERALRTLNAYNRSLHEASLDPLVTINSKGRIADVNTSTEKVTGYSREELIGTDFSDYFTEPELAKEGYQRVFADGTVRDYPLNIRHRDGHLTPVLYNATVYRDESGKVSGVFAAARDITERKRAEEQLRLNGEIVQNMAEGVALIHANDGNIVYANPRFESMFGYDPGELTGRPISSINAPGNKDPQTTANEIISSLKQMGDWSGEVQNIRKDGTTFWCHARVSSFDHPQYGQVWISVHNDITNRKRAEEALKESEQRLNAAQRIAKVGDITWNVETGDVAWSDALYDLMQYDKSEKIDFSKVNAEIHHPDDLERVNKWLNDCIASGSDEITPNEYRVIRKDGKILFVHTVGVIRRGVGNQVTVFITLQDITNRKLAEEALRESEEKFRTLFESMAPGVFYQRSDGILIDANPAALSMFGLTREQFMGRDSYDPRWKVVSESGELLPAEQHPSMIALRSGKMVRDLVVGVYNPKRDVMRWLSTNAEPQFRTGDATPYQVFVTMYDITERKRAEDALRESHDRFETTIASLDDAVLLVDPVTHLISECNDATTRIFGYSHEELVGRGTGFLHVDPAHLEQFGREASATYENPGYYRREFHMRRKDGGVFPTEHFVRPIKDPNGRILYVVSVVCDITERKKAEETILHALAEKEVLLREIHHRVKNNLAGIIALINLQTSSLTDPNQIYLFKDLETRIRSMALVHESLYQTKDIAHIRLTTYTENLTRYLFQVYETVTNVRCRIDMGEITMPIETATPCGLVITEIITNSLKYAFPKTFSCEEIRGEPCTISIAMHREGSDYILTIADNGIGIPEGTDVTIKTSLGLYLIRFIVKHQLQGSTEVSTGNGTAYTIRFPEPAAKERKHDE
jgi:PAS domain S-box-containing protein